MSSGKGDMRAHKVSVTVPEDHRLEVHLPEEFPAGPAELIVLAATEEATTEQNGQRRPMTEVIAELRSIQPTEEEERILDELETFRRDHPFHLSSLSEP